MMGPPPGRVPSSRRCTAEPSGCSTTPMPTELARRRAEPMMMALTYGHWYLIGWGRKRDAVRWFRSDRVRDLHLTSEPVAERHLSAIGECPATARPVGVQLE